MVSEVMKKDGPGMWHSVHTTAAWADTPEKVKFFYSWIREQLKNLKCKECRGHAAKYIEANPPEKESDPFIWSWKFHNAVNSRLGKPEMEYDTAKKMYLDGEVLNCTQGCEEKPESSNTPESIPGTVPVLLKGETEPPTIPLNSINRSGPTRRRVANTLTHRRKRRN